MNLVRLELRRDEEGTGRVALVTLDDPDRRNALSPAMVGDLIAAMDEVEGDASVGAVVVTGAAPAFCAGADLGDLAAQGAEAGSAPSPRRRSVEAGLRAIYEGFLRVARSPLPTLAAVNGPAVGAGLNLALACDVRIAGRSARFDARFLDLGLHPGGGNTFLLDRIGGPQLASALVLFGQRLDGAAAAEHGLAWECVEDDDLLERSLAVAGRAASAPRPLALRAKETLRQVALLDSHAEAVDVETGAQVWSLGQPFFAERLQRLRPRRPGSSPRPEEAPAPGTRA